MRSTDGTKSPKNQKINFIFKITEKKNKVASTNRKRPMQYNRILTYRKRRIKPQNQDQQDFQALQGQDDSDSQKSKVTLEKNGIFQQNSTIAIDRQPRKPLGFAPSSQNQQTSSSDITETYKKNKSNKPSLSIKPGSEETAIFPKLALGKKQKKSTTRRLKAFSKKADSTQTPFRKP